MKKVLVLLGLALSFFLVSCADEPYLASSQNIGSSGNVAIAITGADRGIDIVSSQVTQCVISLTAPNGSVQTQTWSQGGANVFYFTASTTGSYTIREIERDRSNYVTTNSLTQTFQGGYNYYVSITLGGNIIVTVGATNTTSSGGSVSVSSVSSTPSSSSSVSVSSSVSSSSSVSISSSSSTGSTATIAKVYTERTAGTQISMDPSWEIWPSTGDAVVFNPVIDTYEGGEAIECDKGNQTWLGFVIKSLASGGVYANLNGYTTLNFALKATTDFPLTIQVGCGQAGTAFQKWYNVSLIKDGNWHAYSVMITNITTSLITNMQWLFAMRSTGTGDWSTAPSSYVIFDDVYYSK